MIPFLVKLANLLDTRGQYDMAREVDDLVNKIAQSVQDPPQPLTEKLYSPYTSGTEGDEANVEIDVSDVYNQLLALFNKLNAQAQGDTGVDQKQMGAQLYEEYKQIVSLINKKHMQLPDNWNQVQETLINQFNNIKASNKPEEMPAMYYAAADALRWLLSTLNPVKQKVVSKSPKHRANALILEAQQLLNVKMSGAWDKTTNSAFLAAMEKYYPAYIVNGKFKGTLKDAVQLLRSMGKGEEARPVAVETPQKPVAPQRAQWTSRYYNVSTPRAQMALKRLDEAKKNEGGMGGQDMVNAIETQALQHNKNPLLYISQDLFEEMLDEKTGVKPEKVSMNDDDMPRKAQTLEEFAKAVNDNAKAALAKGGFGTFGDRKVFIAYLWAEMRIMANKNNEEDFYSLQEFKDMLVKARRAGLVSLARADFVQEMDPMLVQKSRTQNPGGDDASHVNFVVVE